MIKHATPDLPPPELRAEIERLTGSVSTLRELREWDSAERDRLRARIERLEAALRVAREWMPFDPNGREDTALVDAVLAGKEGT